MSEAFDDKLRRALRPVDPGEDFTRSVMEGLPPTIAESRHDARLPSRTKAMWWSAAAAAAVAAAAVVTVGWRIQEQRELEAGLRAREQLLEALQVTSEKLNLAYRVVHDRSSRESEADDGKKADPVDPAGV